MKSPISVITVEEFSQIGSVIMHCFWCTVQSGELVLKEHEAARWLTKDTLDSVDWLPADLGLIESIKKKLD